MRERDLRALEFDKVLAMVGGFAASGPGRAAAMALAPSSDADEVRDRLRASAELVELRGHAGSLPMQDFTDQRRLILAASRGGMILDGVSLVEVRDFVMASRHVQSFLRSRVESFPHLFALAQSLVAPKELADQLLGALADDGGLLDEASPELKRLRNRLREGRVELENRLARALSAPGMEPFVSDYVVTMRNRRFVLPLKLNYTEKLSGIVQDRSVSGETLFVEPMWAVDLNNRLMMLERSVDAEETRILMALTAMVGGYATELGMTYDAMVALDALNARAILGERLGGVEPRITEEGIELVAARHPLLVMSGREVVPIDLRVAPEQRGVVISGPNTGGKTVALKTLGLLALMAQSGLLIPTAEGSALPVFRSIFADIGDEQSIEANLSSFSAHIANLTDIVQTLAEPALVIIDEPGTGTDPAEGAALATGLMDYLGGRRCITAIATHSMAVKLHAYSQAGFEAVAVDFDEQRLLPLYRLKPHTIGQSYGLAIARRLGLPEAVLQAAEAARPEGSRTLEQALRMLDREREQVAEQRQELEAREQEITHREHELAQTIADTAERAAIDRQRMRNEVQTLISELRGQSAELLHEVRSRRTPARELGAFLKEADRRTEQVLPDVPRAPSESAEVPLRVGDQVELGSLRGELLELAGGRAVVGSGALRIEVAPERLRRAQKAPQKHGERAPRLAAEGAVSSQAELSLIGMRTTEALARLEEFLDQAYLSSRSEVRVVHGIGSGALKKAVQDYLSASPYCAAFHQAEPHQGGAGATVVELSE